jgi:hypothetical protein
MTLASTPRPHRFSCGAPQQGGYACAFLEHFALFAPAFGRRPYFAEARVGSHPRLSLRRVQLLTTSYQGSYHIQ